MEQQALGVARPESYATNYVGNNMTAPPPPPPRGWYPDPGGANTQRYFDGTNWTDHLAPLNLPPLPRPTRQKTSSHKLTTVVGIVVVALVGIWIGGKPIAIAVAVLLVGMAVAFPDLISGWSGDEYRHVNNAMLRNTVEPVLANADNFQHISIQQGTKYYGVHLHPIPIPARESDPRDAHENFFHDQEDYVAQMGAQRGFRYTALRPQLVTGSTPGTLNVLPAIGAYGAIRRELGEPFGFPGGPSFVWEAADADLVADVMVWSAESPNAANQAFNVTNGDVFEWRSVWPAIAAALGVHAASDTPLSLAEYLSDKGEVWRRIAERHGLRHSDLHALTGYGDQHADFAFAYGAPAGPRAFVSTVKLRQAGYTKVIDTEQAFSAALKSLIDQKFLPPASVHVEQLVSDGSRGGD